MNWEPETVPAFQRIQALRQSAERISDSTLKSELLDHIGQLQTVLVAKQGEIDSMRRRLSAVGSSSTHIYDPPI